MKEKSSSPLALLPRKRRGVTIKNADDIRKLLAKLIRRVLESPDAVNQSVLKTVAYASTVILKAFEVGSLEDRIKILEEKSNQNDAKTPN